MNSASIQANNPTKKVLMDCLVKAVARFNNNIDKQTLLCARDKDGKSNIEAGTAANEPTIAHRVAFYLECELRLSKVVTEGGPISVDCEFNRHLNGRKKLTADKEYQQIVEEAHRNPVPVQDNDGDPQRKSDGRFEFLVIPDIVVHERQCERNYLVVEIKKRTRARLRK